MLQYRGQAYHQCVIHIYCVKGLCPNQLSTAGRAFSANCWLSWTTVIPTRHAFGVADVKLHSLFGAPPSNYTDIFS